jgi:chromatin remodeling complex protein RSC6
MPRTVSKSASTAAPVAAAPTNEKKSATTNEKKTSSKKEKKVAEPVVEAPAPIVEAPVAAIEEPSVEHLTVAPSVESVLALFQSYEARCDAQIAAATQAKASAIAFKNDVKRGRKAFIRVLSKSKKLRTKRVVNPDAKPSGFKKPTLVSDELAVFLGREKGTTMSRHEVGQLVRSYAKDNKLTNGRFIVPDAKLGALLNVPADKVSTLTYFSLQTYLKTHFLKSETA